MASATSIATRALLDAPVATASAHALRARSRSIDAVRGFVMVMMLMVLRAVDPALLPHGMVLAPEGAPP